MWFCPQCQFMPNWDSVTLFPLCTFWDIFVSVIVAADSSPPLFLDYTSLVGEVGSCSFPMQYLFCPHSYLDAKLKLLHLQVEVSVHCWVIEEKQGWSNAALLDQNFFKVLEKLNIITWEISRTPSCLMCNTKMEAGRSLATRDYASRIASWRFVLQTEHNGGMATRNSVLPSHCSASNRCLHWSWYCPYVLVSQTFVA